MPKTKHLALLFFLIALSLSQSDTQIRILQENNYVTNPQRGFTVTDHCNSKINRLQLYAQYGLEAGIPHGASVSSTIKMNTSFIGDAISGNWSTFGKKVLEKTGSFFIFLGAWIIGLAVALVLIPVLLCCCICPWKCPLWNRKRQNMPYTRNQLIVPAIFSLVLLLVIFITSIVGISSRFKAKANYNEVACGGGVLLDDIVNGNISFTDPTNYFSGVRTAYYQIDYMNKKISDLNKQIAKLNSKAPGVVDAKSKISTSMTSTAQVPSTSNNSLVLTYDVPLQNTPGSTTATIDSTFPETLGNKQDIQSLVGKSFQSLVTYQGIIELISSAADAFTQNAPSFTKAIKSALSKLNKVATDLQTKDMQVNDFLNKNESIFTGITIGQYVILGMLIGLTVVMVIALSCTVWGGRCRHFMYFLCGLLFFLCIISFLFCIFVSIINPMIYYTCEYAQENLNSKVTLNATLVQKFKLDADYTVFIAQCVALDGKGDVIQDVLGQVIYLSIQALNQTYNGLTSIAGQLIQQIGTNHNQLFDQISKVRKAQIADITDQTALSQLISLSKASDYTCNSNGFTADSWIPSVSQVSQYVPCQVTGSNSDSTTCTSSANFNSRAAGCTGCMDTFDLFKGNGTYTDVRAALALRYPDASCNTFNSELANVWGNFYKKKIDVLTPVQTRAVTAKTNADSVVNTRNYFDTVQKKISSQFSTLVDSSYGLINGLRCKTVRQDLQVMKNVLCNGLFLYTYFTRVIFGILSFALLFLMCCVTCTGHRNFKSMDFRNEKYDDKQDFMKENQYNLGSQQKFVYNQKNAYQLNKYPTYL